MNTDTVMKYAAIAFLMLIALSSVIIGTYDVIQNRSIPPYVSAIITSGLTYSFTILGVNHGSVVTLKGVNNGQANSQQ